MTESASRARALVQSVVRPVVGALAVGYFLFDALAYWVVRPLARWIGRLPVFARFAAWARRLGRYPSLLLVLLPLAVLEPAKPAGAWLLATGRPMTGLLVLAGAELVKITLVERLFHLVRPRVMTIPWFAWGFTRVVFWLERLKASAPWRAVRRAASRLREAGRRIAATLRNRGGA